MSDTTTTVSMVSTITETTTRTLTKTIISTAPSSSTSLISSKRNTTYTFGLSYESSSFSLYQYSPSLPLAIIFTILYFTQVLYHAYLSLYLPSRSETINKHRYTIPLFVAATLSTLGYLTRCISIQKAHVSDLGLYAASTAQILISPIFICATLYLLLARLVTRHVVPPTQATSALTPTSPTTVSQTTSKLSFKTRIFSRPKLLSILFLTSDVLSFLLQALGSAIAFSAQQKPQLLNTTLSHGIHILLSGLILQLLTFTLYMVILHLFCLHVRNEPTSGFNPCIMKVVTATWIASGFIFIRGVFRVVEFAVGLEAYPAYHEWCLYVFEAVPVLAALMVLAWWHPVSWVQERRRGNGNVSGHGTCVVTVGLSNGDGKAASRASGHVRRRSRVGQGSGSEGVIV